MIEIDQLLSDLPFSIKTSGMTSGLVVTGITFDSRKVQPGYIFVPLTGVNQDGHAYIPDALKRGAVVVVGSQKGVHLPVPYLRVEDTRQALAFLSAGFYGNPARKLTVIGVTGTDGKTTTCNLIYSILRYAGLKVGMISTVNAIIGDEVLDTGFHVTTPDAPDVQRYLAHMVTAGLSHVVLEATSHGLAQHRVAACEFDIGVVTNITHEHLDFHGDYEHYMAAKAILFSSLTETHTKASGNPRLAVFNLDDRSYPFLDKRTKTLKVTYSLQKKADIRAEKILHVSPGTRFLAVGKDFHQEIDMQLAGDYNVSNCLAALCTTVLGLGIEPGVAAQGIARMEGVPGRFEKIDLGQDFIAIVDFAHTPNALKVALQTARQTAKGKVIVVFGSAGLRDRAKRRMMAEVSIELADMSIFTAEDPRTESLDDILAEMAFAAVHKGGVEVKTFWKIRDRGDAIRKAIELARPGDMVITCGKGHEQSMCFETVEYPWDDRVAMRAAIAEKIGVKGEKMPFLPTQTGKNKTE
jgi:UDP-N-acetylmuramoyl-L-alanyl-D-glutamate--2,6-diaminopimelate ligase